MAKLLAFAVLLLLPLAFATQIPLQKFLNASFEPDQNVTVQPLLSSGSYVIVSANGHETYAVNSQSGKPLNDAAALASMLQSDVQNSTGFDAKLASAQSFAQQVQSAKNLTERQCMQYTGTDMHECTDKQTCTVACFAVPQCVGGPLYSDGFWEAMLDWNTGRKNFDSLLSSYSSGIGAISSDQSAISQEIGILNSLEAQSQNFTQNPLFLNQTDPGCSDGSRRCFEYCAKIDYSSNLTALQIQNLQSLKASVLQISQQPARANAILAAAKANDDYLSTRGSNYQNFRLEMENTINALKGRAASLQKNMTDPQISPLLDALSNMSASINAQADAGYYKAALAQKTSFEQQANTISGDMDADAAAYNSLSAKLASLNDKITKGEKIIGNDSASAYRANVTSLTAILSSKPTSDQLAAASSQADAVTSALTEEIAAKALGENATPQPVPTPAPAPAPAPANQTAPSPSAPVQSPFKLPCIPGLALLALIGFGFARPSRKL